MMNAEPCRWTVKLGTTAGLAVAIGLSVIMLPVHADETEDTASDFAALTGEGLATALSDDKVIGWSQWEAAARQGRTPLEGGRTLAEGERTA